jgi:hypothetical protein
MVGTQYHTLGVPGSSPGASTSLRSVATHLSYGWQANEGEADAGGEFNGEGCPP